MTDAPLLTRGEFFAAAGATIVAGTGPGKRAGIVWLHWLGDAATSNHTEFAADAQALAARGATSVLPDLPWSAPDWFERGRRPETDAGDVRRAVTQVRATLDLLTARHDVDPRRIALVGHDFGAMIGALVLAVDPRPRWAVYLTPALSFWEWYLLGRRPADVNAYLRAMSVYDLPPHLARSHAAGTLLQFARRDAYVSAATAAAFRNALPDRDRTMHTYDVDHRMDDPAATADRRAWLVQRLALAAEAPPAPNTAPP